MTTQTLEKISGSLLVVVIPWILIGFLLWIFAQTQGIALAQVSTGTIRVATNGVDTSGCGSETTPCRTIQYAVDLALDGDEVLVASGVYTSNQVQVVHIADSITLRGGYTITNWTLSDPIANPTQIDARGLGRGIYIATDFTTIEGMQIISGTAAGLGGYTISGSTYDAGGGIYSSTSDSITLTNNIIIGNGSIGIYGGGIFISQGSAYLEGNEIYANSASYGGGIFTYRTAITLVGNEIALNQASDGGGVYLLDPSIPDPKLINNTIYQNEAAGFGGGVYWEFTGPTLEDNTIIENSAERGAGIYGDTGGAGHSYINNNSLYNNHATAYGGGAYLTGGTPHFDRNQVNHNSAATEGGGLYVNGWGIYTNNMIVDNESGADGGGVTFEASGYLNPPSPSFFNNTVAHNVGANGIFIGFKAAPTLSNTIIAGHDTGIRLGFSSSTANLDSTLWHDNTINWSSDGTLNRVNDAFGDPDFLSPGTGDYHIGLNSLAIDQGVGTSVIDDFDGEPRPQGLHYEIGADETGFIVTKQSDPTAAVGGAPLTYTIRVVNYTHLTLPTTVTDTLPLQVVPGGNLIWSPTIPASGGVWTATVVVTPDINYNGYLTNTVRVSTQVGATAAYTLTTPCTPPMPDQLLIFLPYISNPWDQLKP